MAVERDQLGAHKCRRLSSVARSAHVRTPCANSCRGTHQTKGVDRIQRRPRVEDATSNVHQPPRRVRSPCAVCYVMTGYALAARKHPRSVNSTPSCMASASQKCGRPSNLRVHKSVRLNVRRAAWVADGEQTHAVDDGGNSVMAGGRGYRITESEVTANEQRWR